MKRLLAWFRSLFGRAPVPPADATTAPTDILPPVEVSAREACAIIIRLVEEDREANPGQLIAYDPIAARVWDKLPTAVRGADTAVNRAEFAAALRAAIRFHDDVFNWMATPE